MTSRPTIDCHSADVVLEKSRGDAKRDDIAIPAAVSAFTGPEARRTSTRLNRWRLSPSRYQAPAREKRIATVTVTFDTACGSLEQEP